MSYQSASPALHQEPLLLTEEYCSLKGCMDLMCAKIFKSLSPLTSLSFSHGWGLTCDCYAFGIIFACLIWGISSSPISQHDLVRFRMDCRVDTYYLHLGCVEVSYPSSSTQAWEAVFVASVQGSWPSLSVQERIFVFSKLCRIVSQPSGSRGRSWHWHLDWLCLSPVLGVSSTSSSPSSLRQNLECSGHSGEVSFFGALAFCSLHLRLASYIQLGKAPERDNEVSRRRHIIF